MNIFLNNILIDASTVDMINQIINGVSIGIFVLLIVGLVLSTVIGFFKGIFSTSFRLLFILGLAIIAFVFLPMLIQSVFDLDLSMFFSGYLNLSFDNGAVISIEITSLRETFSNWVAVILQQVVGFNGSSSELAMAALSIAEMFIAYAVILTEGFIIGVFGNLNGIIAYQLIFKRFFAKMARKTAKLRVVSLFVEAVNYVLCCCLFLFPFTSMVNIANQAWQKYSPTSDDETVTMISSFMDTYNNSILAQSLFNWSTNNEGLTIDSQMLSSLLQTTIGDGQQSVVQTLNNLANLGGSIIDGFTFEGGNVSINYSYFISESTLTSLFGQLNSSNIFTYVLPLCLEIAINSELLGQYVDTSLIDIEDDEWINEINNLEQMVIDIANSGVANMFFDEENNIIEPSNIEIQEILNKILSSDAYTYIKSVFKRIDNSKLLSRAIPAAISYLGESNEQISDILPSSWAELNSISWGEELSIVYDSLYRLNQADSDILKIFLEYSDTSNSKIKQSSSTGNELMDVIVKNASAIKTILIGEFDEDGNLLNCDEYGITKVYENNNQINNRHYTLFDTNLFKYMARPLFEMLTSLLESQLNGQANVDDLVRSIDELLSGEDFRKKLKEEFNAIIIIFEKISQSQDILELISSLNEGSTIDSDQLLKNKNLILDLQDILPLIDNSKLLTSVIHPVLEDFLSNNGEVGNALATIGLSVDDLNLDIDNLGQEFANLLNVYSSIDLLNSITDENMSNNERISNITENYVGIANLLDTIFESEIINPKEEFYDGDLNNNYFTLLNFLFESSNNGEALIEGFEFKEDVVGLRPTSNGAGSHNWANTRHDGQYQLDMYGRPILDGENGYIALVLASLGTKSNDVNSPYYQQNLFDAILGSDESEISNVIGYLESDFKISRLFKAVDDSSVFSASFGQFLDTTLDDPNIGIIDEDAYQSFTLVSDWTKEGENFAKICNSIKEVGISLNDFDITNVSNIPALNVLLHSLSNSKLFGGDITYNFNSFLYQKLSTSLNGDIDLLSDPSLPNEEKTYIKAMNDFDVYINEEGTYLSNADKNEWCSNDWMLKYSSLTGDELLHASENLDFYNEDIISKVCSFLNEMNIAIDEANKESQEEISDIGQALTSGSIPSENLELMLLTLNDVKCLRMPLYHVYVMIRDNLNSDNIGFDLSSMNAEYIQEDTTSVDERASEISYLVDIYDSMMQIKKDIGDTSNIDLDYFINNKDNLVILDKTLVNLNASYVFHRSGPSQYVENVSTLSSFQTIVKNLFNNDGLEEFQSIYYSSNLASKDQSGVFDYTNYDEKIDYNLLDIFSYNSQDFTNQENECHRIIEIISSLIGGYKGFDEIYNNGVSENQQTYLGLLLDENNQLIDFSQIDMTSLNVDALKESIYAINDSDLLYDCVPNLLSYLFDNFVEGDQDENRLTSSLKEALSEANPFYVYHIDGTTNYLNRYPKEDETNRQDYNEIDNLCSLLSNAQSVYSNLENQTNDSDLLYSIKEDKNLVLFDDIMINLNTSFIFHRGGPLNTNNFTTFQHMISEILSVEQFSNIYYSQDANSKDQINEYLIENGKYTSLEGKIKYNVDNIFSYRGYSDTQQDEINRIFEILSSLLGSYKNINEAYIGEDGQIIPPVSNERYIGLLLNENDEIIDISKIQLETINTYAFNESLDVINDSDLLYDCVPNIISYFFDNIETSSTTTKSIESIIKDTIDISNPYYVYYVDGDTNYNRHYEEESDYNEIDNLCILLENIKTLLNSNADMTSENILSVLQNNKNLKTFNDILIDLNASYIFHRGGPKIYQEIDVLNNDKTTFMSIIESIIDNESISQFYYSEDLRSKDQSDQFKNIYSNKDEKISYNLDLVFPYDSQDYSTQVDNIHDFINIISSFVGGYKNIYDLQLDDEGFASDGKSYRGLFVDENNQLLDVNNIKLNQVDGDALYESLTEINNSDLLYDVAPNMLAKLFNDIGEQSDASDDITVMFESALKNANPYYIYYLEGSNPNYNIRYAKEEETSRKDYSELIFLCDIVDNFEQLYNQNQDVNLIQIFNLSSERLNEVLSTFQDVLSNMEQSYIFHRGNIMNMSSPEIINRLDDQYSTFEYSVDFIYKNLGAPDLVYSSDNQYDLDNANYYTNGEGKIRYNIYCLTALTKENEEKDNVSSSVSSQYWQDEITSLINFINSAKTVISENNEGMNNFNNFEPSLDDPNLSPDNLYDLLLKLNHCNVICDILPNYLNEFLDSIRFNEFTNYTYNNVSNNYATIYFGQNQQDMYASDNGIPLIKILLDNFAVYDSNNNFHHYINLNEENNNSNFFENYINSGKSTANILYFIENSIIYSGQFNVNLDNSVSGVDALFIYNIFDDANMSQFIYGDNDDEKILLLNRFLNDEEFEYDPNIEGKAFDTIFANVVKLFDNLDSNFATNDIDQVRNAKDIIVRSIVALTKEVNSSASGDDIYLGNDYKKHRAYISSEILASLLDEIVTNEINKINNISTTLLEENIRPLRKLNENYPSVSYDYELVNTDSYNLLNINEARGLDGILSLYQGSGTDYRYYLANPDLISSTSNKLETIDIDYGNSYFASVIYSSRLHNIFNSIFDAVRLAGQSSNIVKPEIVIDDINDLFIYGQDGYIGFIDYSNSIVKFIKDNQSIVDLILSGYGN